MSVSVRCRLRKVSLRRNGCLTMRGDGGDVIMKALQREDCYQPTDGQKVTGGHCRLWTYGAPEAAQADTPYCDCYRGVCAADGASVIGNCAESPKNTVVVTSTVVPGDTLSLPPNQPSADVIASTAKDVDSRTDQTGLDPRTTDFPRPSRGAKEEDATYNRRSPFQPLHQVMMYDDHLYQTSGLAYRYSMQLARGIHAPGRVAECLEYSNDGNAVTERPDGFGFTGTSTTADKDCRSNDCPTSG